MPASSKMEASGMKKFTRRARLIRELLLIAAYALRLVKLAIELLNKVANCDDRKLRQEISFLR